jgi:3-hydroxyisobutyrate dehydrogenase-like beta-hydroxyacid dehydrogenase
MDNVTVGLLHPGEMGVTVGVAALENTQRVIWASEGRSPATRERAERAGLRDAGDLPSLVDESEVILSVCPPSSAVEQAREVAARGFDGIYVDANAVSPQTARVIAAAFGEGPVEIVDGGIIGPPARNPGTTRLYLSGRRAGEIASLFTEGALEARSLDAPVGAASALKMSYAAYTKGGTALLAAIHALAQSEGVRDALLREWEQSQPELPRRSEASIPASAVKAWRFVGEMREIASTFEAAGLPGDFHRAAAEVYSRLAEFKDAGAPPSVDEVAKLLRRPRS